jgi:UPF0755 protein
VRRALLLFGVLLIAGLVGLAWLVVVYPNQPPAARPTKTVPVALDEHSSLQSVARDLTAAKLIAQPRVFELYARVLGAESRLRSGIVLVTSQMTPRQLLQRVAHGYGTTPIRITIPEGFNRFDIATRLDEWGVCPRDRFLAQVPSAQSPPLDGAAHGSEGYLFPDTYWLHDEMAPELVIQRLTENAQRRLSGLLASEPAAFARLQQEFGFGVQELVILASIVEKEARVRSEQPIIAGVFLNRLRDPQFRPKRLQADPTVAYGCLLLNTLPSCSHFDGKHVTRIMTADAQNPYNTYRLDGLPPAPIANPGLSALRAVLVPATHDYFYFVARADGHHAFSTTLALHNLAVQQALQPQLPQQAGPEAAGNL